MDRFELRYSDFSLDADQVATRDAFRGFFARECPAWMAEHEPAARPDLIPMAFATAARIATHGTTTAAHMQGGLGYTVEADASLYFLRAKGWSLLAGDPNDDYRAVGDLLAAGAV